MYKFLLCLKDEEYRLSVTENGKEILFSADKNKFVFLKELREKLDKSNIENNSKIQNAVRCSKKGGYNITTCDAFPVCEEMKIKVKGLFNIYALPMATA